MNRMQLVIMINHSDFENLQRHGNVQPVPSISSFHYRMYQFSSMRSSLCSFVVEIEWHGSSEVKDIFLREGATGFSKQLSTGFQ